jgi:hypothetical protein
MRRMEAVTGDMRNYAGQPAGLLLIIIWEPSLSELGAKMPTPVNTTHWRRNACARFANVLQRSAARGCVTNVVIRIIPTKYTDDDIIGRNNKLLGYDWPNPRRVMKLQTDPSLGLGLYCRGKGASPVTLTFFSQLVSGQFPDSGGFLRRTFAEPRRWNPQQIPV